MDIFNTFDWQNATFVVLSTVGFVNAIGFWKKDLTSVQKFIISLSFAFVVSFVPQDIGNFILNKAKDAIAVALIASGGYKVATKIGGK